MKRNRAIRAGVVVFVAAISSAIASAQHLDFEWAGSIGGPSVEFATSAVDASGFAYVMGNFDGVIDADPGDGVLMLTGLESNRYICKLDPDGQLVYAIAVRTNNGILGLGGDLRADAAGGVYITGSYEGSVDFNPGMDVSGMTCPGISCGYLLRLDAMGEYDFAVSLGGAGATASVSRIAIDASDDLVLAGQFRGTVDFDPGAGLAPLISESMIASEFDLFVLKLDSTGGFISAGAIGGVGASLTSSALTTDASSAIYAAGTLRGTADFDPGAGTAPLSATGASSGYLLKLNSAGNFAFALANAGTGSDTPESISIDSMGALYIGGHFQGQVEFDPGAGAALRSGNAGSFDAYVQKLNAAGTFQFVQIIGGARFDQILASTIDANDNLYVGGIFEDIVDFDPGPGQRILFSATEEETGFLLVLDRFGDLVSLESFFGDDEVGINGGVALGPSGSVIASGQFRGVMDADPSQAEAELESAGGPDGFIVALTPNRRIYRVPETGFIVEGDRVEFFAPIGGLYQWSKDGMPLADDPPRVTGVDTHRLVIESAQLSDAGVYRVQYDNGAKAITTSDVYVLDVAPAGSLPVGGLGWLAAGIGAMAASLLLRRIRHKALPNEYA